MSVNTSSLVHFIRHTLGCGCPDSVFENIEQSVLPSSVVTPPCTRIVVGETLLVYLVSHSHLAAATEQVIELGRRGRADRDEHGYNRFRLVLSTDPSHPQALAAAAQFDNAFSHDEKMHIHLIEVEQADALQLAQALDTSHRD
jgi:hypothetical protein